MEPQEYIRVSLKTKLKTKKMMTYLMDMKMIMATIGHFQTQRTSINLARCLMHWAGKCLERVHNQLNLKRE